MEQKNIFPKVFLWLFVGLLTSGVTGYYVSTNPNMMYNIYANNWYWWLSLLEIGLVIFLSARIHKMSYTTAMISYLAYSILTGATLASIFEIFTGTSIALVFGITSFIFVLFAVLGYVTKMDLTKWGNILLIGLLGTIIVGIVNIFLGNSTLELIVSVITIVVFIAFIAYDIQKIKHLSMDMEDENKVAIIGALELYLDFINIFLQLLSLFGKRD